MAQFYGTFNMDEPNALKGITLSCSKCRGMFSAAKKHSQLVLQSTHYAQNKQGVVNHEIISEDAKFLFCPGCLAKFKLWLVRS